jgi:GNAT superfamily N-acetyltransferase
MSVAARFWQGLNWLLSPLGELTCAILLERSLAAPLPEAKTSLDVILRQATEADMDAICRLYSSDPWLYLGETSGFGDDHGRAREFYLDRLRRGEMCFLAESGQALAHVNWLCSSWGDALPGHPLRLAPGEVYTTDGLTTEAFRGKGLHAFVLRAMLEHARARGGRHADTLARLDRTKAHKGLFQLGWQECGRTVYFLPRRASRAWFLWRRGKLEPLFRAHQRR